MNSTPTANAGTKTTELNGGVTETPTATVRVKMADSIAEGCTAVSDPYADWQNEVHIEVTPVDGGGFELEAYRYHRHQSDFTTREPVWNRRELEFRFPALSIDGVHEAVEMLTEILAGFEYEEDWDGSRFVGQWNPLGLDEDSDGADRRRRALFNFAEDFDATFWLDEYHECDECLEDEEDEAEEED